MATMKSVRIHTHGGPETLVYEDAPRPTPLTNEVLIRVRAASVNPIDGKIPDGYGKQMFNQLSEARQAQEMSQSGRTRGKIVLQVVD